MPQYSPHLVAFIDLLGFSEAIRDGRRAEPIFGLLKTLAGFQGDFFAESQPNENGRQTRLRPAISAFSDNIVLSYRLDDLEKHSLDLGTVIIFLQNLIAFIAWNAFASRLLIRGGVAIGDLYHAGGVVYGPALLEAYETERSLAVYPRVALGQSVILGEHFAPWRDHTWTHDDGVKVLGYHMGFVMRTHAAGGQFDSRVKGWLAHVRAVIQEERAALTAAKNVRALSKWDWFNNNFEQNLLRMNPQLLESDTPPHWLTQEA
jgi:hypothetical protein